MMDVKCIYTLKAMGLPVESRSRRANMITMSHARIYSEHLRRRELPWN